MADNAHCLGRTISVPNLSSIPPFPQTPILTPISLARSHSESQSLPLFFQSTPPPFLTQPNTPTPSRPFLTQPNTPMPSRPMPRAGSQHKTHQQKIQLILDVIDKQAHWTFARFLHEIFHMKEDDGVKILQLWFDHPDGRPHEVFRMKEDDSVKILQLWFDHPDGRPKPNQDISSNTMYSPETPYLEIKPARPALTSFAVQIVDKQLRKEQQKVLQPETGLAVGKQTSEPQWVAIGRTTLAKAMQAFKTHQPLLWHYVLLLSSPRIRIRNGVRVIHKYHPPEPVSHFYK
ncbi:hypothetical protein SERLA73DRAFT_72804 [Serpula lacrymans var. lacrymans S7.3]|uniref:Uncharacterized protein n=2 Tax=Serpula lacrymans var. lacrymans TaxID=341189 RepID=F8PUM2_SERL3|nr:uncharacterized protein SERLADRAFT_437351 [Serpula lacrymans var. lacrymans S7.9]EGO00057.1 hypothetical protein SERLA73DRAFT_72804 [Serpula lacrymans var. lacrymans S7.3]EGO25622.1 hypothetical protein SERLADRAFT_437351 [Serpula lacrymans var. lacrymans S7.9]